MGFDSLILSTISFISSGLNELNNFPTLIPGNFSCSSDQGNNLFLKNIPARLNLHDKGKKYYHET